MDAGQLTKRATLLEPIEAVDADGQIVQSWAERGTVWGNVRWLRGGESVMQARLASRNPVVIVIRNSERARQITSEWRIVLRSRSGVALVAEIKEDPRPSEGDAFLEFLAEA